MPPAGKSRCSTTKNGNTDERMNHTWHTLVADNEVVQVDRTCYQANHMHAPALHVADSTRLNIDSESAPDTQSAPDIVSNTACCSFFHWTAKKEFLFCTAL